MINIWTKKFYKISAATIFALVIFFFLSIITFAEIDGGVRSGQLDVRGYQGTSPVVLLEDWGGLTDKINIALSKRDSSLALAEYINMIVKVSVGFLSIGAVALLVWGGVEYITAQSFTKKSGGKDKLMRALGALAILFTSFILFTQLNPELLKVRFEPLNVGGGKIDGSFSSVFFGDDSGDKKLEDLERIGYKENCKHIEAWESTGKGLSKCQIRKDAFARTHPEKEVKGCFIYSTGQDQACFLSINKDKSGEVASATNELSFHDSAWNVAKKEGFSAKKTFVNSNKEKCTAEALKDLARYTDTCYCYTRVSSTPSKSCSYFYKDGVTIEEERNSIWGEDGVGDFITGTGKTWTKQECTNEKNKDEQALKSRECYLEAVNYVEWGYFQSS